MINIIRNKLYLFIYANSNAKLTTKKKKYNCYFTHKKRH